MADRVALYLQDAHSLQEAIKYVQYAESRGFEAVWQAESRLVRDAIREGGSSAPDFSAYGVERLERMRRLREAAMFMSAMAVDDCDNRLARRAKFFDLQMNDPLMMAMMGGMFAGPENAPPEAFDGHLRAAIVNA